MFFYVSSRHSDKRCSDHIYKPDIDIVCFLLKQVVQTHQHFEAFLALQKIETARSRQLCEKNRDSETATL